MFLLIFRSKGEASNLLVKVQAAFAVCFLMCECRVYLQCTLLIQTYMYAQGQG
jgi:hypothetical protein